MAQEFFRKMISAPIAPLKDFLVGQVMNPAFLKYFKLTLTTAISCPSYIWNAHTCIL